ncbi:unnamed protein product [Parnassius apollo]|uniref:(apollo) hypothetical protein n=1 Tax=Parnassius apollo TaxID=110799 RepID=A0A8S3X0F1_PARAO|nr:unnamed protein product [Parnassius apollo]
MRDRYVLRNSKEILYSRLKFVNYVELECLEHEIYVVVADLVTSTQQRLGYTVTANRNRLRLLYVSRREFLRVAADDRYRRWDNLSRESRG